MNANAKKKLNKWSTFFHKWFALTVGVQVALWILSGLVMVWWDIDIIHGDHTKTPVEIFHLDPSDPVLPPQSILLKSGKVAQSIRLRGFMGKPVYEVDFGEGIPTLYDAKSGEILTPISAELAREIALKGFNRDVEPSDSVWLTENNMESRGTSVPVWQVSMNDEENFRLYVSPYTGEILKRRSERWRIYDFFWMLHIMDYEGRDNFNNPFVVWASIFAVIFTVTGIIMLFFRFKKRDFGLK